MNNGINKLLNSSLYSWAIASAGLILSQSVTVAPTAAQTVPKTELEFLSTAAQPEVAPVASDLQVTPESSLEFLPPLEKSEAAALEVAQTTSEMEPEPLPVPPTLPNTEPPMVTQASETPKVPEVLEAPEAEALPADRFGDRGDNRWYIQGAGATNIDNQENGQFGMIGAGISHFFATRHSINGELNSFYFSQNGDDAVGLNLALLIRSHLYRRPNWSLYIDGGAGILGTTNDAPSDGSSFNFTPQAGIGATIGLENDRRLMVGVRWHHISNANTFEDNPGRDSIMGYVGLNFPR